MLRSYKQIYPMYIILDHRKIYFDNPKWLQIVCRCHCLLLGRTVEWMLRCLKVFFAGFAVNIQFSQKHVYRNNT